MSVGGMCENDRVEQNTAQTKDELEQLESILLDNGLQDYLHLDSCGEIFDPGPLLNIDKPQTEQLARTSHSEEGGNQLTSHSESVGSKSEELKASQKEPTSSCGYNPTANWHQPNNSQSQQLQQQPYYQDQKQQQPYNFVDCSSEFSDLTSSTGSLTTTGMVLSPGTRTGLSNGSLSYSGFETKSSESLHKWSTSHGTSQSSHGFYPSRSVFPQHKQDIYQESFRFRPPQGPSVSSIHKAPLYWTDQHSVCANISTYTSQGNRQDKKPHCIQTPGHSFVSQNQPFSSKKQCLSIHPEVGTSPLEMPYKSEQGKVRIYPQVTSIRFQSNPLSSLQRI